MPLPVIYTDHPVLRPCAEHDVDALHRLWTDSDVRRCQFDDLAMTVSQAADMIRSGIEPSVSTGLGFWAIYRYPNAPLLGFCGFRLAADIQEIELLYGLLPQYWGQG
jgi:RimJ/RimL family protein N-acetyltransferase